MKRKSGSNVFLILSVLVLAGCTQDESLSIETISRKEYSEKVVELESRIEELELQVEGLKEQLASEQSNRIWPARLDDRLVFEVSEIPFALSLPDASGLPLVAHRTDYGFELIYQQAELTQSLRFYSLVPKIRIKQTDDPDDYFNPESVVKDLGNGWVVVEIPALDTSLDEATNARIKEILSQAIYY